MTPTSAAPSAHTAQAASPLPGGPAHPAAPPLPAGAITPAFPGVDAPRLAASFAACRDVTRSAARNFYYGLRLTPEPRRSAVYSIYAWMRLADDLADKAGELAERRRRLDHFGALTDAALAGRLPDDDRALWPAFAATVRSYPIQHAHIRDMLAGLREDLDHAGYATRAELDRYCYRVGSTVGLVCIAIWGLRPDADHARAAQMAINRGRAFQLTNILRDIGQDFDDLPRRVYLPREDLDRHALTAESLRRWADPARCTAFVAEQARIARALYKASEGLEALIDPACSPAMWGMTQIYAGLLGVIEADPARVVGAARIRLSSARKGLIAVQALLRSRRGAWGAG